MNRLRSSALLVVITTVVCFSAASAQQNNPTAGNGANDALRQKAFDLLESVAGQISTLQSAENRARLGSNIAASLWEHDERRARTLLLSVEEDIRAGLQNQEEEEPADAQRRMVFLQLRVNTVERIARHDAELALSFFKATEATPDASGRASGPNSMANLEVYEELRLARQVAAANPEVALRLARESLAHDFSYELLPLLRQLNRQHKDQGLALYSEIVAKLKRVDLTRDYNSFSFAQNLARSVTLPATDDASFRELISMFVESARVNGCSNRRADDSERSYFCQQIASLLPLIERVNPSQAASLRRWESREGGGDFAYEDPYEELNEVAQDGAVDDILALRTKYPRFEGNIYWRAVEKAASSGDIERAQKLATDYAGDPRVRQSLLELVDRKQKALSEFRAQLKDIQMTLDRMPRIEQRVDFLLAAATTIAPDDRKEALKLLDRASGLVDTMKSGKAQLEVQIVLAITYCAEKNDRGLTIMESLVPKLNELVGAAAKLDNYENHHLRDGEWNMANEGVLGSLLTGLAGNASYFAWCDFDRAASVSAQFERPEIRFMAQVKLAQGILAGPPKPFSFTQSTRWEYYEISQTEP